MVVEDIEDIEDDDRWPGYREVVMRAGFRSVLGVPLPSTTGETMGALNLYDSEPRAWDGEVRETGRRAGGSTTWPAASSRAATWSRTATGPPDV